MDILKPDYQEALELRLAEAGRTLMMLPGGGLPADPGSCWPDVVQSYWDMLGAGTDEASTMEDRIHALEQARNAVQLHASRQQIDRLDEALGWLLMIPQPHWRKAVMARMLTHPVSERPMYKWSRIARDLGTNPRTVQRWHEKGLKIILVTLANTACN